MDLERLDEALERWDSGSYKTSGGWEPLADAARAYRDLLANGAEPDYEAAFELYANQRPGVGPVTDKKRVRAIVDAAIGDRLLVDHPEDPTNG